MESFLLSLAVNMTWLKYPFSRHYHIGLKLIVLVHEDTYRERRWAAQPLHYIAHVSFTIQVSLRVIPF